MKIIVVGCGKVGTAIVSSLVGEGHDVVVVDNSPQAITEIRDVYDIMCICGNGANFDTLVEAGADSADMFVSVTGSDELNMLSCIIARRMGIEHTVCRVRNPEYNDKSLNFFRQQIDLSLTINPEFLTAQEIFNILKLPAAVNIETFSRGAFELVELILKQDTQIVGMSLAQIKKQVAQSFLVCVVQRGDEVIIPDGKFVLEAGDRIGITAPKSEFQSLLKKMGIVQKHTRNVMILGASTTAFYLAKMLIAGGNGVKIIDKNRETCLKVADLLPQATVINSDGSYQEVLLEEGLSSTDAFLSLTGLDEQNIIISCYASSQNVPKVIAKVNRAELTVMAEKLGLDCVVSPKNTVSDVISRYARALQNSMGSNVETLYKLMDGKAEALEFNVQSDFKYQHILLKDLELRPNILIAGIIRKRKPIIPKGDDEILAGDKVIVIAAGQSLNDLSDIMR
ncbi:MAG: Trk system potassium transporter TrkA [Clostridia bacterium]|nr:Trk system potassium transporter TrkA [Clostridia bacterium]